MLPTKQNVSTPTSQERLPIWMAALLASGAGAAVRWECMAGRAVYLNPGTEVERIETFGIEVPGRTALLVTWRPGDTAYTVELCAPERIAA